MAVLKCGARGSRLSKAQAAEALAFLSSRVKGFRAGLSLFETPGDRDLSTPIDRSAPDFFTRDIDEALLRGEVDMAVHSAKDLPERMREGLDWFWLPAGEDPRDCWVSRDAMSVAEGRRGGGRGLVIGVSSARRGAYAARLFPRAELKPVRGAVDSRLAQVAQGRYDAVISALAGLSRLFPEWRLGEPLPECGGYGLCVSPIGIGELTPPEGQGRLAVVFRKGDRRFMEIRRLFVKAVRFTSAGVGSPGLITVRGAMDLREADVVLADGLSGFGGRAFRCGARWIDVGKRCGAHSLEQEEIDRILCDEVRKGWRTVRLKGGDAGLFGRLAEEIEALEDLGIPYLVRPGVSALVAASAPNGLLLTKRGEAAGFRVSTPRSSGKGSPRVFFMASRLARSVLKEFPPEHPYAMVWDACGPHERVETGLCGRPRLSPDGSPGLLIVGYAGRPFSSRRVLLTCSAAVMPRAVCAFEDRGWRTVEWPMIELKAREGVRTRLQSLAGRYDAIVLTSPSAVRIFFSEWTEDRRGLPRLWTCGPGTDAELRRFGVSSDLMPEGDNSANGLVAGIRKAGLKGLRVLRLRSSLAGRKVASALRRLGMSVDDVELYCNSPLAHDGEPLPACDAVFFASASGVAAYLDRYGARTLAGRDIYVMGAPTRSALPARFRAKAKTASLETAFEDRNNAMEEGWRWANGN